MIMLVRTVIGSINHACRWNHIPAFVPFMTLIPLGYLLTRALTTTTTTTTISPRPPRVLPKEDDIFAHITGDAASEEKVLALIKESPSRLLSHDRRGRLPLHVLCQHSFPRSDVFRALIIACPGAVSTPDKFFSALPLHMAVHHDTQDLDMIKHLINIYPEALLTADGGGFIPLHRAIHRKVPDMGVVQLLLHSAPQSVKIKTTNGNLPLHWVVSQDPPCLEAVALLYNVYPEAIHVSNDKDATPLDILIEDKNTKSAVLNYVMQNLR